MLLPGPESVTLVALVSLPSRVQPLMDNLEAQTYETFEKDACKYQQYQAAIRQALSDRITDEQAEEGERIVRRAQ